MIGVRLTSLFFVSLALMVLGADMLGWLETDTFDPHTLIAVWSDINQASAAAAQGWVNGLPDPVSGIVNAVLHAWAFVALGLPGVLLAIAGAHT